MNCQTASSFILEIVLALSQPVVHAATCVAAIIGEDFSPSTRYCRKKLIEFAKRLKKPIKLSVDKLRIDNETYIYDHATDSVVLHKT